MSQKKVWTLEELLKEAEYKCEHDPHKAAVWSFFIRLIESLQHNKGGLNE